MNKFSAGIFCFFMGFYVFNGIQASYAGLFDAKKKEPFGGEPRQDLALGQTKSIKRHSYRFLYNKLSLRVTKGEGIPSFLQICD
ncbi:hypothetical protein [Pedobacter kyonggii]|uniref:Uncharacterized protein n=1 Tax=Pedobacter kyonggii TaxID=1926871 RepID=A0A4Q9HEB7_9SPHI|nr:hypothetical protein [Pedobacter kyonggii]TBO42478.1 hypothetical protein EYS08_11010 [Pedobacter kyonggii]